MENVVGVGAPTPTLHHTRSFMSGPAKRAKIEETAPFAAVRKQVATIQSLYRAREMAALDAALVAGVYPETSSLRAVPFAVMNPTDVGDVDDDESSKVCMRNAFDYEQRLIETMSDAIALAQENGGRWHRVVCNHFHDEITELIESTGLFVRPRRSLTGAEEDAVKRFQAVGANLVFFSFFDE